MRDAGVLLPVSALPSRHGIGDFGKSSYEFVKKLKESGVKIWQILPLNPLGFGNSPYQPYSSYAGDELYISLELLKEEGLIREIKDFRKDETRIDYQAVRSFKEGYLREAFDAFRPTEDYEEFRRRDWVYKYAVFITLKKANNLRCWNEWPKEQREWIRDRKFNIEPYKNEIRYEIFLQYIFYKQWMALKKSANQAGIKIMGDIPIYVGIDSLDVWDNQECFLLDLECRPAFIAGVPPDYFSESGQRWGNPIYNWDFIKTRGFDLWVNRLSYAGELFDIVRIDHFRGFDTYWKIPASCPTAVEGEWVEAPGYELFEILSEKLPDVEIVAEDLGDLRPEVLKLRDHFGLKGMKVVQFTFDPNEKNNNFQDRENMIIYTGTHDNQTIRGWYESQKLLRRLAIRLYLWRKGYRQNMISHRFIAYALDSIAAVAVVPIQDIMGLGDEGRLNTPGTLGSPNWEWKLADFRELDRNLPQLKKMVVASGR
ncbi:4-alpha-glucanotransferase [Anaerobium acetethylicum]|uniref:4-alpha-glucanotransferase n=1 Tax=Anaerobium acetethylicum TaxID=1619234 RepID=A0A1D3TZ43_9FIRM|nr:4-alpha-glucanotransferase [Anaerobium acetethylicum]SCP99802.1 4-alpha-glucanotransferase [Anaerobium acetethylicum]